MKLEAIPRPPSLVEKVCEQLALIVRRDLKVVDGWLPTERELSTRLGVSRSVVREATKRLESQGLVEIRHGIGIKAVDRLHRPLSDSLSLVIPDMADRLRSLIEARLSIEPDAAAFAAERATKKQLRELRATHERLESASSQDAAVKADCAFHRGVAEASGNLVYRLILDSVAELDVASRLRSMGRVGKDRAIEQHAGILEAMETRKATLARRLMRDHILAAGEDLDLRTLKRKKPD
jgi:DNA-binding FadR family transcriptional regulator